MFPVRLRPCLSVEVAAGMAGDLVALVAGPPDIIEPLGDIFLGGGKADIGTSGGFIRRLIGFAVVAVDQEYAGEEIGELRIGALRQGTAAIPKLIAAGIVERDQHVLRLGADGTAQFHTARCKSRHGY